MELKEMGKTQYGLNAKVVDAVYVSQPGGKNEDNPWITALPPDVGYDMASFTTPYTGKVSGPETSVEIRKREVREIMDQRFPLTFQPDLLAAVRTIMERSYSIRWRNARRDINGNMREVSIVDGDGELMTLLCGITGSGKTTSIGSLIGQFPQVITHHMENGSKDLQIPFLYAVMRNKNSDMSALLMGLADYGDMILNLNGMFASQIKRANKLDDKIRAMINIIQRYHVGTIIIDEIQNMDFFSKKVGSIQALIPLLSETKVGVLFCGTLAAYNAIYSDPEGYIARRAGEIIHASDYCSRKAKFKLLVREVFKTQWFPTHVEPDDSIVDALFHVTGGTVGRLMQLYRSLNLKSLKNESLKPYIKDWKPFVLDEKAIYDVDVDTMPGMAEKLDDLKIEDPLNDADGNYESDYSTESHLASSRGKQMSPMMERKRRKVLSIVREDFNDNPKYNPETIEKHVDKAFRLSKANIMSIDDLVDRVEYYITAGKTEVRQHQTISPIASKATKSVIAKHA